MIIEKTYSLLKSKYRKEFAELTISDVKIGIYLTAVRLSDNSTGISATLTHDNPFCAKANRDFGEFTPLKIRGQKISDILETQKESGILSSLKTAVLSAVSSGIISSGNYKIIENCDPIQLLDLKPLKIITIVGAFQSYIRKIAETNNKLFVLELNENALATEQKKFYIPAGGYRKIIPTSDIVIITGQTIVNRTIDDLLSVISPGTQVIVTGPSSSILPDVLFENKVTIIGTFRITDPEILFDIVSEGGTGYHLYKYCAQKICILKGDEI
ncbi:MAG: DUF364 domain-containing protein [Bacteroidales bacterium]